MKKLFTLIAATLFAANLSAEQVDITDKFTYTWNEAETLAHNDDGSITYNSASWGGLAAWLATTDENNQTVPADWSGYKKVVFEFGEATTCNTQILAGNAKAWGDVGITSLECVFDGVDMSAIEQIALQTSDAVTMTVKRVYLDSENEEVPFDGTLWEGSKLVDNWADQPGFLSDGGAELKKGNAEVGDYVYFWATAASEDWQVQIVEGHWGPRYAFYSAKEVTKEDGTPEETTIIDLNAQGYFSLKLTQEILDAAYTSGGWGNVFLLNGTGQITVTKLTLVKASDVPSEETVTRIVWTEDQVGNAAAEYKNGDFVLSVTDTDGKIKVDANDAYFGTADAYEQFSYRMKSGGKSSSKNALQLTIPADGTLKVYARTGSNSAEDRNLVLTQDGAELYNQIVKEADAALVTIGENEKKVYPVISVAVKAGTVDVTYPVGSMNFYGFEIVTAGGTANAIESVEKTVVSDGAVYNLRGQRVDASYKGLVIRNGKKFLQK